MIVPCKNQRGGEKNKLKDKRSSASPYFASQKARKKLKDKRSSASSYFASQKAGFQKK